MDIDFAAVEPYKPEFTAVREAHGFAQAGGVAGAVKAYLKLDVDRISHIQVSDLSKKNIALLNGYARTGKAPGNFIEVMACANGCITGPSAFDSGLQGKKRLSQQLARQDKTY